MTSNTEPLDPKDHQTDDQVQGADAAAEASTQARGAFDLRKGKIKREGRSGLYVGIGVLVLVVVAIIVAGWMWVISEMRSDTSDIDESQVKADATLEVQEQDDATMQRIKEQKIREMEEAQRRAAAEAEAARTPAAEAPAEHVERGSTSTSATPAGSTTTASNQDVPPSPLERTSPGCQWLGLQRLLDRRIQLRFRTTSSGRRYAADSLGPDETRASRLRKRWIGFGYGYEQWPGTPRPTGRYYLRAEQSCPGSAGQVPGAAQHVHQLRAVHRDRHGQPEPDRMPTHRAVVFGGWVHGDR
ncbi:hypothetical protein ACEP30_31220 [Pseudomonas aeruginosa]|uniref:hypothetical protein n=1 Tax=Pseudomonas aeruginosa TaxID=287 RepID=UPI0027CEEE32|nr:hypothetical protein [Pseudomonas aeruginosa]MDQ2501173.1 hypothetical protein [Pseudomonas aeruginosa]